MSDEEYARILKRCAMLMELDPAPESLYGRQLLAMTTAIERYEREHFKQTLPEEFDAAD